MGILRAASLFVNCMMASPGMPTDSGEAFSNVRLDICFYLVLFHVFAARKNYEVILGTQAAGPASIISQVQDFKYEKCFKIL